MLPGMWADEIRAHGQGPLGLPSSNRTLAKAQTHLVASRNRGAKYRPQIPMVRVKGTPEIDTLNVGKP